METRTRREWIRQWCDERGVSTTTPDGNEAIGPRPVSAKAVYRLADKLDLPALRIRAFQHICGQLTAQNIPAEVFSRFSSTFEDVRKVRGPDVDIVMTVTGPSGVLLETLARDQEVG